jgi:hypothetical protein
VAEDFIEYWTQGMREIKVVLTVVFFYGRQVRGAGLLREALQELVNFFVHPFDVLLDALVEGVPRFKAEYAELVIPPGQEGDDLFFALSLI